MNRPWAKYKRDEDGDPIFVLFWVFRWTLYKGEALFTFGRECRKQEERPCLNENCTHEHSAMHNPFQLVHEQPDGSIFFEEAPFEVSGSYAEGTGGGVLAWCYSREEAANCAKYLRGCRRYKNIGFSYHT